MYIAAEKGQVGTLKALISAGANVNTAKVVSIECVNFLYIIIVCTTCIPHLELKSGTKYRNRLMIVDWLH